MIRRRTVTGDLAGIVTCEAILIEVVCDENGASFLYVITICVSETVEALRMQTAKRKVRLVRALPRKAVQ